MNIRSTSEDGGASIKAEMRKYYRRAKIAELLEDTCLAEDNMRIFRRLKMKLASIK